MMDMNAKDIELQLWRSGLLKADAKTHVIENAAILVTSIARRHDKARLQACNGIERYDPDLRRMMSYLTEADQAKIDKTIETAESDIVELLKAVLQRGVVYDFRRDPRGAILRFVNKDNTKDGWVY
jgi:hypothetical protein